MPVPPGFPVELPPVTFSVPVPSMVRVAPSGRRIAGAALPVDPFPPMVLFVESSASVIFRLDPLGT